MDGFGEQKQKITISPRISDDDGIRGSLKVLELFDSVRNCEQDKVEVLLDAGLSPNWPGPIAQTPLHWAAASGNVEICRLLLNKGALVNAADRDGETPLHFAAYNGRTEVCKLLLDHGALVQRMDKVKASPLDHACSNNHKDTVELLEATIKKGDKRRASGLNSALQEKIARAFNEAREANVQAQQALERAFHAEEKVRLLEKKLAASQDDLSNLVLNE